MLCTPRSSWISLQAEPVASSWCLARAFAATEHFLQSAVFPDTALPQKMPCDNKFLRHASTLKPQLSFRLKAGLSHILPGRYGATTGWSRPLHGETYEYASGILPPPYQGWVNGPAPRSRHGRQPASLGYGMRSRKLKDPRRDHYVNSYASSW